MAPSWAALGDWLGFHPMLHDSLPVIGRSSACPQVVYAFGHQHLGWTLGCNGFDVVESRYLWSPASRRSRRGAASYEIQCAQTRGIALAGRTLFLTP